MTPNGYLERYPLFRLLGKDWLTEWLSEGRTLELPVGETIFREGGVGDWAYLLLGGSVRVLHSAEPREVTLAKAEPGELFGEYALVPPYRNTATCRVAAPATVVRLPLEPVRAALAGHPDLQSQLKRWLRLHALLDHLRERSSLGFMSPASGLRLAGCLVREGFRALRTIQTDGLADDRFYFILEGAVAVHAPSEPVRELGPGESFGEKALAGRPPIPAVVALADTTCWTLSRADFAPQQFHSGSFQQSYEAAGGTGTPHPWIGQRGESDCGVAALAMVAAHFGIAFPTDDLRRIARNRPAGFSVLELKQLAQTAGLGGEAVRVDPNRLGQVNLPAIAHWTNGHFVVVFGQGENGVVVGDPASAVVTISVAAFLKEWSGCLMVFSRRDL